MGHVGPLPIYARIQEEEQTESFPERKRKKKWTGWKPKTDEQKKLNLRKKVTEGDEDKIEEDSAVIFFLNY